MFKKKRAASLAAFAALAGSAGAQSSVTIFGIVDASISHYSVKSDFYSRTPFALPPVIPPAGRERSLTVLGSGNNLPSRIGFRGTEDLGGGLAAGFWLESALTNDDGAVGLGSFARRSTVSLSSPFGEVRLGRDYTTIFWADTIYDPLNNIGVGANLVGVVNGRLAAAAALAGGGPLGGTLPGGALDGYSRSSNSIGYFLPPGLGGIYGQLQYGLHETVKSSGTVQSPSTRGRIFGARLGYASGPLDVSGGYTQSQMVDAVSATGVQSERKIKTFNIGAAYDFGPLKLHGELSRARDVAGTRPLLPVAGVFASETSDKYDGAMLGLSVPVGPGSIRASYSRVKFKDDPGLALPGLDASANKIALGYVHNLSKRTALYATAARIRISNGENNPVLAASTGNSVTYLATGTASGFAPRSATGYDLGIRHSF